MALTADTLSGRLYGPEIRTCQNYFIYNFLVGRNDVSLNDTTCIAAIHKLR